jgi:nicotinamide mononucleotide transporter
MPGFDFLNTILESIASLLGFVYVFLIAKQRSSGWLFGILSSVFFALFFYRMHTWGLFSQQIAYILLGFYGLATWSAKKEDLPIRSLGKSIWIWILGSMFSGFFFFVLVQWFTKDAVNGHFSFINLPNWRSILDAQFFIFSLIATWLTTRKILENWHIWIVVNVVGTIWFAYEHWWSTSALYLAYLILAINGLRKWKKELYA